jgi:alginate O-acetyltransferase complex protein AlgI
MIFNTWDYYLLVLLPSALLFRVCSPRWRLWVVLGSGGFFFLYFSYTQLGGIVGAVCLGIFLWESLKQRGSINVGLGASSPVEQLLLEGAMTR